MEGGLRHIGWIGKAFLVGISIIISATLSWGQVASVDTISESELTSDAKVHLGYEEIDERLSMASISSIRSLDGLTHTFDQNLQGLAAGVQVVQNSGFPGASTSVRIRGIHTLAAGAEPLYIIDGFPLYNNNSLASSRFAFGPPQNGLSFIDPADIASIDILKDAAATSMYGARGSNGVIVVRTKRGQSGRSGLSLTAMAGLQSAIGSYDLADGQTFAGFVNQANIDAGLVAPYASPTTFATGTDWQSQITREDAWMQKYRLALNGGTEKISFLVSGSYANTQGIIRGSDWERLNLRANIDAQINDKLSLQNSLNFGRVDALTLPTDDAGTRENFGVISGAYQFNPLIPSLGSDGRLVGFNYQILDGGVLGTDFQGDFALPNPLALATAIDSRYASTRINDVLTLNLDVSPSLTAFATLGLDAIYNDESTFWPGLLQFDVPLGGIGSSAKMQSLNWFNQFLFKYRPSISERHRIRLMAGFSQEGFRRELLGGQSSGFENEALSFYSLAVGKNKRVASNLTKWSMQSYIGNVHYTFDQKFALQLSARADASSRFANEWEVFPTASVTWYASNESFIQSSDLISGLSLKLNYGVTGNQEIAPYSSFALLDEFNAPLNGATINGISLARIGNESLEVERTHQWNLGFDLGLYGDQLRLSMAVYNHDTKNALLLAPLPATAGSRYALLNGAKIANRGLDVELTSKISGGKINWQTGLIIGFNEHEIEALPDNQDILISAPVMDINEWSLLRVGHSVGSFLGFQTDGLASANDQSPAFAGQTLQAGDQKYRDVNGDGVINGGDRVVLGTSSPSVNIGFSNQINYGSFELRFLFQGLLGRDVVNFNRMILEDPSGRSNVLSELADGSGALLPSARNERRSKVLSDAIVENGAYLRLQNIRLAYRLSDQLLDRLPFSELEFFVSGQNLLTITGYSGVDPDVSHFGQAVLLQGVDFGGYPKARSLMGGLKVQF